MPGLSKRGCIVQGCPGVTTGTYCEEHLKDRPRQDAKSRGSAAERGYDWKWHTISRRWLKRNPWCTACGAEGVVEPATVVDHVVPHRGDMAKFWNKDGWQGLCGMHHARKTATEDGGFGRAR